MPKIKPMGVKDVRWFEFYSIGRKRLVILVNGTESELLNIALPVLRQRHVYQYLNRLRTLVIWRHKTKTEKLGRELESCSNRLVDNKLSLHLGKTECIIFGPKRKL